MNSTGVIDGAPFEGEGRFRTTSWSAIWSATRSANPTEALAAWERLCHCYWRPIHAHIRHCGNPPELAKDLTQDFFYHLLRRERLKQADQRKGKFRAFLLTSLNRFLHSEWDRRVAQKRDERLVVSLDGLEESAGWRAASSEFDSPDRQFEYDWAAALLAGVRRRLETELKASGKEAQLALLSLALYEEDRVPYRDWAARLNLTEDHVKKIVQRLREQWQKTLKDEVRATVEDESEVEPEIRYLLGLVEHAPRESRESPE